jgi:DegV family protein with EDD domain
MVAVVADSAANLPDAIANELGIHRVPLYLRFGNEVYRDGTDLTPADFYQRLVRDRETATTSVPSPGDFREVYRATGDREVLCVTVASSMSSSHQQATFGGEGFEGRVVVIDSRAASMAEGFVAMEAARAIQKGATLDEAAERAQEVAAKARLLATIDTFEFLRKSGRVNALQAYAATMLDIRPVFEFRDGVAAPLARSRTRRKAIDRIVDETLRHAADRPLHLAAIHAAAEADANALLERIQAGANVVEHYVAEVTPVIGAHTGPGLVGTAFFCD